MIETLMGMKETVNFKQDTTLRLYNNTDNEAYPKHWHAPLEIIMPIKNGYTVICYDETYHLYEGDLLFINPGVIHHMEASQGNRLILQADYTLLHDIKSLEALLSLLSPIMHITKSNSPETHDFIQKKMIEIHREYFSESPLSEAAIYAKLIEMFVHMGRHVSPHAGSFDHNPRKYREYTEKFLTLCDYINDHCSESLTLEKAASMTGYSKYHFNRLFKTFTGMTFYRYLNKKRIEKAEKMLVNHELTITEIALSCGFGNLSGFIRMFKQMKECTPTEFKHMYTS